MPLSAGSPPWDSHDEPGEDCCALWCPPSKKFTLPTDTVEPKEASGPDAVDAVRWMLEAVEPTEAGAASRAFELLSDEVEPSGGRADAAEGGDCGPRRSSPAQASACACARVTRSDITALHSLLRVVVCDPCSLKLPGSTMDKA